MVIEITDYCHDCKKELLLKMETKRDEDMCDEIHKPITELLNEIKSFRKRFFFYGIVFVLLTGGANGVANKVFSDGNHNEQRAIVELINQINRKVDAMQVIQMEHKDVSKQNKELLKGQR
jgi:hypothetical protein